MCWFIVMSMSGVGIFAFYVPKKTDVDVVI